MYKVHIKVQIKGEELGGSFVWSLVPYTKSLPVLFPGQGTYLGCGFYVGAHTYRGNQSMFPSLPYSLKSIKMSSGED